MFLQFLINGIVTGILYSLAAVGFALVYNTARIFHVAAAAVYTIAAYAFFFAVRLSLLPLWMAGVIALVFAATVNIFCDMAVYRPLARKGASPNVIMISSIGLMIVLINVVAMIFGNETKIITNSIQPSLHLGSLILTQPQMLQLVVGAGSIAFLAIFLKFSSFGLKARALGNDPMLFEIFGFNTGRTRLCMFGLSGLFLGLASCLSAYDVGMSPHGGMTVLINALVAMIIGGTGRFLACAAGGILLGILQALVVWQFAANWQYAVTFLLLIIFLFFRPQGLLGIPRRAI